MQLTIGEKYLHALNPIPVTLESVGSGHGVGQDCIRHADGGLEVVSTSRLTEVPTPNLASRIAKLEGLTVLADCPTHDYCMVQYGGEGRHVRYDPVHHARTLLHLIEKYGVDLDWDISGGCKALIYREGDIAGSAATSDHNGCLPTTILNCILEANKS